MGPCDDQDVGASAVSRAGHPQRPRVRRGHGEGGGDRVRQGGQLLYWHRGSAGPGRIRSSSAACGYRALGQVRVYTACLCFGLDLADQARTGFRYNYSIYQAEYSRNLLFASGAQMEDLFDRILDRTRSRLDIPALRTLFGLKNRPAKTGPAGRPRRKP